MRRLTSTHWFRVGLASVSAAGILTALFALAGHSEISVTLQSALVRSEEHTSELQSRLHLVCRLLLEKKQHVVADVRARFMCVTAKSMHELARGSNVLPTLDFKNSIENRPKGYKLWLLENVQNVTQSS